MDVQAIIEKYCPSTGKTAAELAAVRDIWVMCTKIDDAERSLLLAAQTMEDLAAKIRANVNAQAGDAVMQLSAWGEVGGSKITSVDAMVAVRQERIESLQRMCFAERSATATNVAGPGSTNVVIGSVR